MFFSKYSIRNSFFKWKNRKNFTVCVVKLKVIIVKVNAQAKKKGCAFSLTKKTIPLHGVTYIQLFGQSKRTPIFERNSLFSRSYFFKIRSDVRMMSFGGTNETPIFFSISFP